MRVERIAKRWNLKARARAGRFLVNQQRRLTESARNIYQAGYADRALEEAYPVPTQHRDGQGLRDHEGGESAHEPHDRQRFIHETVPDQQRMVEP